MSEVRFREVPLPELRPVVSQREAPSQWSMTSPMAAVDAGFTAIASANTHLRPRVLGPDDEAAVIGALAARGELDLAVLNEAAGPRVLGPLRRELVRIHQLELVGHPVKWPSLPMVLTGHTYECGKNGIASQDTSLVEALLGAPSHISRVVFPLDYNTTAKWISEIYSTRGQIFTVVVPKAEGVPDLFNGPEAERLVADGAMVVSWAGFDAPEAKLVLTAVGAYQLGEVLHASRRLARRNIPHIVVVMTEPGRFRLPREKGERALQTTRAIRDMLYPPTAVGRVFVTHVRPEVALGVLRPLDTGPQTTSALGYINAGGTLDTTGMLFANRCSWAHIVEQSAAVMGMTREQLLDTPELDALDGKAPAHGPIFNGRD